jgi:Flp pilus assembly protein TadG
MTPRIENLLRRLRRRNGNVMIEFALGSGILLAAFTGTFQFGYTFLQYNNLQNAVTRGARFASLAPYDSLTSTASTAFKTKVKNMVLYGSTTAGTTPVLPGLTAANVNFDGAFFDPTLKIPTKMTVSITGYTINSIFASNTLTNKPQVTYAYQGIWSPIP